MQNKKFRETLFAAADLFMLGLLTINLTMIVFEWLYEFDVFNSFLSNNLPYFHQWYNQWIHQNFLQIDLTFVAIYLVEFAIRWAVAIVEKKHHRWFFYPFIHWYDLLGCVPVGSLRFLRLIRIVSIILRLHKLGFVDLRKTEAYAIFKKYYGILVEEISDRVVVNVIDGVQTEIRVGGPLFNQIVDEVLMARKDELSNWISHKLQYAVAENYQTQKERLQLYISEVVDNAIEKNEEAELIEKIPVMGNYILNTTKKLVGNIAFNAIDEVMQGLGSSQNQPFVEELVEISLDTVKSREQDDHLKTTVEKLVIEVLDVIKDHVNIKQWKIKEELERLE